MQVADCVVKEADDKLHLSCGIHCNIITMETYIKKALHYVSLTFRIYQKPSQTDAEQTPFVYITHNLI